MIGAVDTVDLLSEIVWEQFVNAAVKTRVVFGAAGFQLQSERLIAPKELVTGVFVHDADNAAAYTWGHINLQVHGFEPHDWDAIDRQVLMNGWHAVWLPELPINANQDRSQQGPPEPKVGVPTRRL